MTSWVKVEFFKVTPKMLKQEGAETIEGWFDNYCPIVTEDGDEAEIREKAIATLTATKNAPKTPPKSPAKIDKLKRAAQRMGEDAEDELLNEGGSKKKLKLEDEKDEMFEDIMGGELAAFEMYSKMKIPALKDFCRWNDQIVGGTKDVLVARVIDMAVNGRMMRCGSCQGKWKQDPNDENALVCSGGFDETQGFRIDCFDKTNYKKVPRLAFIDEPPNDEELEAIKEANMGAGSAEDEALKSKVKVKAEANDLSDIDLSKPEGKKEAAVKLLAASRVLNVQLPEDDGEARIKIGTVLMSELGSGATDAQAILTKIVDTYGIQETKEQVIAAQEAAGNSCTNAENGKIMLFIKELKDLYFKEGNGQAGGSYSKAQKAIVDCPFAITLDNVKHLHKKGHENKLDGIGKGTGDKIKEFLEKGTCDKLEEKRAAALGA
eukprot:CAMPEP_0118658824 /NCGR_PEP_ID=MMETSP0785-20121206/14776_1 /TAXON_ID=91992 /ORGANISM="Bolidomonas pacifica, Strain CCMP 1866" /LENGTH=433 /DNA_ID=CAMNT_0006551871 /DNA_START=102 /DNA_END=1403 /DNA_ORIENTATION=+